MTSVLKFPKPTKRVKAKRKGSKTPARRKARKATAKACDRLWGEIVRAKNGGRCWLIGHVPNHVCKGPIQAAHGFSRRYRGTRWDLRNGFPLCAGGHLKYTYDPLMWDYWLRTWWGPLTYADLRAQALATTKPNHAEVLAELREYAGMKVAA